ncbi:MAG: DUF5050 domain-containing protein, partial [Bacillota bacterium]|nr:DUF5050 domain-containing protein [Bacillota bacterium]
FAFQGDSVFFINTESSVLYDLPFSKSFRMFGINNNNTNPIKISSNQASYFSGIIGERIYYSGATYAGYFLAPIISSNKTYCYNLRTQQTEYIGSNYYIALNNRLYYCDNSEIMQSDLDGKNSKVIAADKYNVEIYYDSGYLYYLTDEGRTSENVTKGSWYRIDLDGKNKTFMFNDPGYYSGFICNNIYYHTKNDRGYGINPMYEYNLSTKQDKMIYTPLKDDYVDNLNVSGDWMYYTNNKNDYLYKMKLDGTENELLYKDSKVREIYITKNYIFFYDTNNNLYRINPDGTNLNKINP